MALNKKASPELQALLDQQAEMERQIREARREQEARATFAAKAASRNGTAYAALVLDLYDVLGIEPEHPRIRNGKTGPVEIPTDPDEELRLSRLSEMLERIIDAADPNLIDSLKTADDQGRSQRRDEREAAKEAALATRRSAPKHIDSAENDDEASEDGDDNAGDDAPADVVPMARAWDSGEPFNTGNEWGQTG